MRFTPRHKLIAAGATVAVAAGAGGAVAATGSGANNRQAYLNDAAARLHVSPQQLQSALKSARKDHPFKGHRQGGRARLVGAAASYLGLTRTQLRQELRGGKTLAQIATARGKSTSGLQSALVAAIKVRLDKAVSQGRITQAQEQKVLAKAPARVQRLMNRTWHTGRRHG